MFEQYYNLVVGINPFMDVCCVLNILHILEEKIENKDHSIIHFDGEEFMKFHKFYIQVYLDNRGNIVFTSQLHDCYYKIMIISLQVDYLINSLENYSTSFLMREYCQIKLKVDFEMPPLERICNFFTI